MKSGNACHRCGRSLSDCRCQQEDAAYLTAQQRDADVTREDSALAPSSSEPPRSAEAQCPTCRAYANDCTDPWHAQRRAMPHPCDDTRTYVSIDDERRMGRAQSHEEVLQGLLDRAKAENDELRTKLRDQAQTEIKATYGDTFRRLAEAERGTGRAPQEPEQNRPQRLYALAREMMEHGHSAMSVAVGPDNEATLSLVYVGPGADRDPDQQEVLCVTSPRITQAILEFWSATKGEPTKKDASALHALLTAVRADTREQDARMRTSKAAPVDRDVKPEKLGELAELLLPMAREWTRRLSLGQSDSDDESLATLLAKVHGMGRRCGEEFPVDPIIARLSEWVHEFVKALKPSGADTYGEGVRACKAQVAAILATRLEGAQITPEIIKAAREDDGECGPPVATPNARAAIVVRIQKCIDERPLTQNLDDHIRDLQAILADLPPATPTPSVTECKHTSWLERSPPECEDCGLVSQEAYDAQNAAALSSSVSELDPLVARISKGRTKYPTGCTLLSLLDEAGEVAHAVNKRESVDRVRDELLDVAAVAMRLYFGEIDRAWRPTFGAADEASTDSSKNRP